MAFNINGVVCEEVVSGYSEEYDLHSGISSRKGYLCDWASRFTVAQGLLGIVSTTKVSGIISLYRPAKHPELVNTYCTRVSIEPKGSPVKGSRQMSFPKCIVWAEFNPVPWAFSLADQSNPWQQLDPLNPLVYAEQRMSSSYQLMDLPGYGCTWKRTGLALPERASKRIALCELEVSIKQLPYMPTNAVFEAAGMCNSKVYLGIAERKLLFNGVQTQQVTMADGTYSQEGIFRFTARTIPWDEQYDAPNFRFDQVYIEGGTNPLVEAADFAALDIIPGTYQQDPPTRLNTLI